MEEKRLHQHKALIVHSPHSGRSNELGLALDCLRQEGISIVEVLAINDLDGLPEQGSRWMHAGINLVVAAGGDGLVGGVITHIAESNLPLGILPLGTANDIARSLSIPQDIRLSAKTIVHGRQQLIDIGVARPAEQAPHGASMKSAPTLDPQTARPKQGYFAHALTVGLNVQFAHLATSIATRQRYGSLTYPLTALEVLKNHTVLDVELRFEGLVMQSGAAPMQPTDAIPPLHCRALQVAVINAPIFGGAWQLAIPGASLHDRLLDILVIEDIDSTTLAAAIAHFLYHQEQQPSDLDLWRARYPLLHTAELTGIPGLHHLRVRGVTIITQDASQDVTLDGEIRGQTPIYTCMAKQCLKVIVPAHYNTNL
jgi:diacylglycerol kinase family enzyme